MLHATWLNSPFVLRLGWTLVHSLWEVLLIALVLVLYLPILRRSAPQTGYRASCMALIACVVAVGLTFIVTPVSAVPELQSVRSSISSASHFEHPDALLEVDAPEVAPPRSMSPQPIDGQQRVTNERIPEGDALKTPNEASNRRLQFQAFIPWLVLGWGVGVLLLSAWNSVAWIVTQRLKSAATVPLTMAIEQAAFRLAKQFGVMQTIRLAQSTLVDSPVVIGWIKPVILLPAVLVLELSPDHLEALLAHELAHILRRDYLVNLLQRSVETVLFYHPGVWWISNQIRQQREYCCDDLAVSASRSRAVYVAALAAVAHASVPLSMPAASGGQLLPRLQRLLGRPYDEATNPARWWSGLAILTLAAVISFVAVAPEKKLVAQSDKTASSSDIGQREPLASEIGQFNLVVVGPDEMPVPSARVEIRVESPPTAEQILRGTYVQKSNYGIVANTDDQGRLTIKEPVSQQRIALNISTDGFAPYWGTWTSIDPVDPLPASFTARLDAAWSVGGIIVDEKGEPVQGVSVSPSVQFKKRPGELSELYIGTNIRTDASGKWRFDSVPATNNDVHVEINHASFRPVNRALTRSEFGLELDQQPAVRIALDRGLTVTGRVTDEDGHPIADALVRTKFMNGLRRARTDVEGIYQLAGCEAVKARIVVSAKGKATDMQELSLSDGMDPVDFVMKPGGKVHIRVMDLAGNPIPKARILYTSWRSDRMYFQHFVFDHKDQFSDENGVWEWNEAPLDEFRADICSHEMTLMDQRLNARDEPYEFRIPPALVITGSVFDAMTKQPIKNFRVVPGVHGDENHMNWIRQEQFTVSDGTYRVRQTHGQYGWLVRIEADGYLPATSRMIKSDEGDVTLNFELTRGAEIVGKVVTPKGQPARNAKIALGTAGSQIEIVNGDLKGTLFARYDCDKEGQFKIPPQESNYQLIILHADGYAHVKATPSDYPRTVTLEAWSRITGTFSVGQKVIANAPITLLTEGIHSNGPNAPSVFVFYDTTTGKDGSFTFEYVVPGAARIGRRMILTMDNGAAEVTSSCMSPINLPPGETVELALGGGGRPVIGRLQVPGDERERIGWNFVLINVNPFVADPPPAVAPKIPNEVKNDAAKLAEWQREWDQTEAGIAWQTYKNALRRNQVIRESRPAFNASVAKDGSFKIDDVLEGTYTLTVYNNKNMQWLLRNHVFTVPSNENEAKAAPVDLGELTLGSR